jgi:hypothetical protein
MHGGSYRFIFVKGNEVLRHCAGVWASSGLLGLGRENALWVLGCSTGNGVEVVAELILARLL